LKALIKAFLHLRTINLQGIHNIISAAIEIRRLNALLINLIHITPPFLRRDLINANLFDYLIDHICAFGRAPAIRIHEAITTFVVAIVPTLLTNEETAVEEISGLEVCSMLFF